MYGFRYVVTRLLVCTALFAAIGLSGSRAEEPVRLLVLGDSLAAGYGLPAQDGFTAQLQEVLQGSGHDVVVQNAGVSGDTTAGGWSRLEWALADGADAVIVELGANDMLRGIDPGSARSNLAAILATLDERGIPTLVAGMRAPQNLGPTYVDAFERMYPELAQQYGALIYPFFLDGVAGEAWLNQEDGIHPNRTGVRHIVESIMPSVLELLARVEAES
ncbi:MAG: arylesterase [Proteobacteria bacterium]|nr:arylesterase [Pseudomonadota bacterium]